MMKMNEKVKKIAFSMAGTLAAALVLCAVIIPTAYRSYAMLAVTSFWAVVLYLRKYSLQGTTQGRYLTGGVPPVRFSM